jgi:V/A-type H+-transporting ATPase subunit D
LAKRILLTRPELKKRRDMLAMFERYLPMLKLKQQQLQVTVRKLAVAREELAAALRQARRNFEPYAGVLGDVAGLDVRGLSTPTEVHTGTMNVAGVNVPVFEDVEFPTPHYSLFATPVWVDAAIADLREISRKKAEADVLEEQYRILERELTKILQRVNLFEKVKIPECREAIRVIRIKLGDEMTSAVGRAKIAKSKLAAGERNIHRKELAETGPQ